MRLKSLELQGFKSFPNKTVLRFDNGLTVVVGPNGSGKSNISDAIRWVLGELSSKSIRGKSMQDVIFKGTSHRSPMTFAEVTLTFDNTAGVSRLPIDTDEVSITRRYYRNGDSEYQINRQPARLKDIVALLMNTGLGKSGYSMINQGKTTEIISAKSDERRHIFEEAAGISGYRASKDEAERKMKQAEENLRVVEAKYDMLREQIIPLEKEAERARKYLELSAQRKQADVSLWLYDMEKIRNLLEQLERDCLSAKQELDLSDSSITSFNRQIEELQRKLAEGRLRMEELQESIRTYDHAKSSLESSSAGLQKELEYSTAQIATAEADLHAQRTLLTEREARNAELAQCLDAEQLQYRALLIERTELTETRLPAANEALDAAENAVDDNVQSVEEMEERFTQNQINLASTTTSEGSAASQLQALAQKKQILETELSAKRERLDQEERALNEHLQTKKTVEEGITDCNTNISDLEARYRALTEEMTALRVALNTNRGKVDNLRRMDELLEGYAGSVRAVMEAASTGVLTQVIAPVSKLFTVEERYVIAIETAIGANIQNIVVENEDAAKRAIAFLKKKHAGRATFYPLTSIRPQFLNLRDIDPEDFRGYLGVATEFVTSEARYQSILGYLLGKTLIFDNIENATEFAKANKFHTRIVTLDGQVINAGGSFTGGSVRESGILSRTNNIAHMEEEIKSQEARMEEITKEDHAIVTEMNDTRTRRAELEEKLSILLPILRGREVQVQVARDGIAQLETQLCEQTEQFDTITRESDDLQMSIVRLREENAGLERSIADAKNAHGGLVAAAAARREERDQMQEQLHQLHLQIAVKEKDVEAATTAFDLGDAGAASIKMQIEKLEGQIATAKAHIADATASLEKNRTDAAGKDSEIAAMQQEWERLRDDCDGFEKRQNNLRAEVESKRTARESVIARYSELNAKREQMLRDQEKETNKIAELYQLTYGTALELGYPPVTEENYKAVKAVQTECTHKLRALGSVNTNAVDQYREVKEKFDATEEQLQDVENFKKELLDIITNMESKMRSLFLDTFERINTHFGVVFERLFGAGGRAELSLSDPDNVLESGIEIHVAPPGKIITNLSLLSGGEQSCVAIALLFAILQVSPSPFCVLDEVEAALDEENVRRVAEYAKEYSETIQMIMISHRRGTMEAADVLYGVTMAEQGITTVLSVNANEVEKKLGVKF